MILHSITVGGFRTYGDQFHVGPFDERITVIHAPNATGKTTLLDALYAGLLESHAVKGDKAEAAMRTSGRTLKPNVCVEFTTGGSRYKIEKRFLNGPEARLFKLIDGAFTVVAEDDEVTAFTHSIVEAVRPGRGLMKRDEHFGLGSILWAAQGNVALEKLPENIAAIARTRLGGHQTSQGIDAAVAAATDDWFGKFFTATGKEREGASSGNLPLLRQTLAAAQERVATAERELGEIDQLRLSVANAELDRTRWAAAYNAFGTQLATQRTNADAYAKATAAFEKASADSNIASGRYAAADRHVRAVESARVALVAAEAALRRSELALGESRSVDAGARERLTTAGVVKRIASEAVSAAQVEVNIAQDAATFDSERRSIASNEERLQAQATADDAIAHIRSTRANLLAPSSAQIKAVRKKHAAIAALRSQLDAAILRVTFVPSEARGITVVAGDLVPRAAKNGAADIEVAGSPIVEFLIHGAGTIRASGPTASASELQTKLDGEHASLADLVQPFGTDDIAELERRFEFATELDSELKGRLGDSENCTDSLAALRERLAASNGAVVRFITRYPDWSVAAPDVDALRSAADQQAFAARSAFSSAEAAFAVASDESETRAAQFQKAVAACAKAENTRDQARAQLSVREEDGLDDDSRNALRREYAIEQIAADLKAVAARAELDAFGSDPQAEVVQLEAARAAAANERELAVDTHSRASALLDLKSTAGSYDAWVRAGDELVETQRALACAEREARAAKLLRDGFKLVRTEYENAYLVPIRERTADLYARISGGASADVRFHSDLTFAGIADGNRVVLDTLSTGEREQVQMVGRLALADLLTHGERQLVVLDDLLGATDPYRFPRFLDIIREFAQDRMQFVIATSDKARYLRLTEAKFINLAELRRRVASVA